MATNEVVDDKASGDGEETKVEEPISEPDPPKVLDVELIVDGFGFMPKKLSETRLSNTSEVFSKKGAKGTKGFKSPPKPIEEEPKSPCASSTNIDIVRRYTWKTKNRMIVQVWRIYLSELNTNYKLK